MKFKPSQSAEPLQTIEEATGPMSHVGVDLFDLQRRSYISMSDRFSGFLWAKELNNTRTETITKILDNWFLDVGFPTVLQSDGGPQFKESNELFDDYCREHGIHHTLSSAHYPRSNGLAESGVKATKRLLAKVDQNMTRFREALLEYRNLKRADGYSPAEHFLGRRQRGQLPTLPFHTDFLPEQVEVGAQRRSEAASRRKLIHDRRATSLPPLDVGQDVMIQNPHSLRWDTRGRIKECRDNGRSYLVECEDKTYLRNRRFLRPVSESQEQDQDQGQAPVRSHQRSSARLWKAAHQWSQA